MSKVKATARKTFAKKPAASRSQIQRLPALDSKAEVKASSAKPRWPVCQFCQTEGVWRHISGTRGARCPKCSASVRCIKCGLRRIRQHGKDQCNHCLGTE